MGKKSIKANKNIYQLTREACELTREKAAEMMEFVSADKIEKIESEKMIPRADEILAMAKCYKTPELCNYFCSHECEIGRLTVPEVKQKALSQITLEMIASLNSLNKERERLIEITVDGKITEDEYEDFINISEQLDKISVSIDALKLWVQKTIADGKIDAAKFEAHTGN